MQNKILFEFLEAIFSLDVGFYAWRHKNPFFCITKKIVVQTSYTIKNSRGGLFLLHFPVGRPRRTLSVILPYDARTFLAITPFGNI